MELENQEKQNEIERLMRIINLYETSGMYIPLFSARIHQNNWLIEYLLSIFHIVDPTVKQMNLEVEHSLDSLKSDKTYVLDQPSSENQVSVSCSF